MNPSSAQPDKMAEARGLILRLWDESLPPTGQKRLEALMLQHADVRLLYLEMMRLYSALHQRAGSLSIQPQLETDTDPDTGMSDAMILPAIRAVDTESEFAAEEFASESTADEPTVTNRPAQPAARATETSPSQQAPADSVRSSILPGRRGIALMALAASIIVAASVVLVQLANRKPAATIVASAEAHFDIGSLESSPGTAVAMGKTLNLAAGSVELKLDGGADVIIEGPATFSVTSPVAMNLTSGRISAIAAGRAHGFVVQTPNATVTDLGTQFGVAVDSAGATEIDVFQGQVQVAQARSNGDQQPTAPPTILSTGQAAMVVNGLVKPSGLGAAPQAFVRSLSRPPTIDVVDLICGGDGTSSLRSGAIDQRTGDSGLLQPAFAIDVATPQYHPVPRLPVIDGCFVPNGTIPVDSAGHRFDFGTTSGTCFYQIRAGGKFPWAHRGEKFTAVLGDIDYSQAGHGFFLLHPNAGITFDLRTLRRLHPGMTLTHFRSVVGNTCTSPLATEPAHVSVLVDGRTRFDQPKLWRKQKPVDIDVPLHDSDRFLTLVATDNGISPRYTWIIFGDPWIE